MQPRRPQLSIAMLVCLCASCIVVAPLEEPRRTRTPALGGQTCDGARCVDAAVPTIMVTPELPTSGGSPATTPVDDEDAAAPSCIRRRGAPCDPIARCGCTGELECELDDSHRSEGVSPTLACAAPKQGPAKPLNVPCRATAECAQGLACSTSELCSRYCVTPDDCGAPAECLSWRNAQGDTEPGTGACIWHCDPSKPDACGAYTECQPASSDADWDHAVCGDQRTSDLPNRAEGMPCESSRDCAHNLDCARFGPRICTRYCRTSADCQGERSLCKMTDQYIAPEEPIGHCVAPCDDASLPPAEAWSGGPVWTQEQFQACQDLCGGSASCIEMSCFDSDRYEQCMVRSRYAIASQPGAPCRSDYVKYICSTLGQRQMFERMFQSCVDNRPDFSAQAQPRCVIGL